MPSCIFHIVVDRMIVSRNRLEGGGVPERLSSAVANSAEFGGDMRMRRPIND